MKWRDTTHSITTPIFPVPDPCHEYWQEPGVICDYITSFVVILLVPFVVVRV